jgi:hypothetical protein
MRTNPKAFLVLFGALLLGACGGDSSTGVNGDASGTYAFQSINGNPLPYTVPTGASSTLTFTSGSFTINTGSAFNHTINYDETISGTTTSSSFTCTGTFAQRGNSFTFSEVATSDGNCGLTYDGAWNGTNAVTVTFVPGVTAYYTK